MFKRLLLLVLSLLLVPAAQAQNAFTDGQRALLAHPNLLTNPGYEAGLSGWTKSGSSTLSQSTAAANVAYGKASASWTPANNGETLTSSQVTVPPALYGGECAASVHVKGGSAAVTLQVVDGNPAVLASATLQAETTFKRYELRFTCPSSGTFAVRLQATGSSTAVFVDQWTLGGVARQPQEYIGNQIINGAAEDNYIPSGWATYNDGVVAAPVDGTGGSATKLASPVRDTTAQIDGKASWKLSTLGSGTAEGQGWAYSFTIPAASQLKNALNDLTFDYYQDNTTADLVRVYLYDVTNAQLITPQFASCGGGTNPSLASMTSGQSCHAELAWLATTGASYRLVFHVSDNAGAVTTAHNIWVDNLYVGQHKTSVGTQVGTWQSYTPTFANLPGTATGQYRRVGDSLEIVAQIYSSGAGTGVYTMAMPTGYTINSSALPSGSSINVLGPAVASSATTFYPGVVVYNTSTTVAFIQDQASGGSNWSTTVPFTWAASNGISLRITVPVNEAAGGSAFGENKCEYAYNSGSVATAGGSDTTSFGYGPSGTPIVSIASTTANAGTDYTVRFTTPVSATDDVSLQVYDSRNWMDSRVLLPYHQDNTAAYGMQFFYTATPTDVTVDFGNCGANTAGATSFGYCGGANTTWTSRNGAGWKWRMKKCKAGIPTAFGVASQDNLPGLIPGYAYGTTSPALTPAGGGTLSSTASTMTWVHIGKMLQVNGSTGWTVTGTVNAITLPLPNSYTCVAPASTFSDQYSAGNICRATINAGSGNVTLQDFNTSFVTANFTGSGGCYYTLSCQTAQ